MNKIRYEDFKYICRMCMVHCDINFNKNPVLLDIFHKLTDIYFETNDELPQQICVKCFDFVNEIHSFSMTCIRTHSVLMTCLNNYKNKGVKEEPKIIEDWEINEEMEIKDEVTIDEHEIEFIKDELDNDWETNYTLDEEVTDSTNDLLSPISTNNDEESINDLNKDSKSSVTEYKQNECKICIGRSKKDKCEHISEETFTQSGTLKSHKRMHSRCRSLFECGQCGKSFTQLGNLKVHKRMHSGERPYKCDTCEKSFTQLANLQAHERLHSGEHPYICDHCDKSFKQLSNLNTHKRMHSGERPYKCDHCEKSFKQLSNLNVHKRMHSGERPYKCDQCEKSFTQSGSLNKHKRIHSLKRLYKYDQCKKTFI